MLPNKFHVFINKYELVLEKEAEWEYLGKQYVRYTVAFVDLTYKVPLALIDKVEAKLMADPKFKGWVAIPTRRLRTILLRKEEG